MNNAHIHTLDIHVATHIYVCTYMHNTHKIQVSLYMDMHMYFGRYLYDFSLAIAEISHYTMNSISLYIIPIGIKITIVMCFL